MGFLVTDTDVRYINAESIKLQETVPLGIWKYCFHPMLGSYLEKANINLAHGKIYGVSEGIANHIVEAFKMTDPNKNLGVLMSGGKGLGKSLTAKLVIEQLQGKKPIIIVDEYTEDLPDFLNKISDSVIMLDEFEKVIPSDTPQDEVGPTGQESLLSVLDGTSGSKGNLFILTVNNTYKIDENMKSRPGRIRYHYKFKTADRQTILNYCDDKLNDKSKADEIANALLATQFVSMDIITAVVDEVNKFPGIDVQEILDYMNIETSEQEVLVNILVRNAEGEEVSYEYTCEFRPGRSTSFWVQKEYIDEDGDECEDTICLAQIDWTKVRKIPYYGKAAITSAIKIQKANQRKGPWTVVGATVESATENAPDF